MAFVCKAFWLGFMSLGFGNKHLNCVIVGLSSYLISGRYASIELPALLLSCGICTTFCYCYIKELTAWLAGFCFLIFIS